MECAFRLELRPFQLSPFVQARDAAVIQKQWAASPDPAEI